MGELVEPGKGVIAGMGARVDEGHNRDIGKGR